MIGQIYGSYRITRKIGEGGVGAVYEAEHIHVGRKAAIKVLLPAWSHNELVTERFINEARSSALANHRGIVEIFDCGKADNGRVYLVMELLDGEPLSVTLEREGRLSVRRMTSVARQIAGALAAVHEKGIIHRDLKPDNIFLIPDKHAETGERIKVLDFGVAKLTSTKHVNTFVGVMLGTPLYMSPEQCRSSGEVDARSDIYALGCIMFEMVCGEPPFVHDEASTLAMMHVEEPPPRPSSKRTDLPPNVDSLILRTLSKDRDSRPQSMADLRAELDVVWGLLPAENVSVPRQATATPSPGVAVVRVPSSTEVGRPAITESPNTAQSRDHQLSGRPRGTPPGSTTPVEQSSRRPGCAVVERPGHPGSRSSNGGLNRAATHGGQTGRSRTPQTDAGAAVLGKRWVLRVVTSLVVLGVVVLVAFLLLSSSN
ncbi:MAG: serine/threonine protein kinase [Proteobacteria bacterium]|nr:serine/threonine protein kinase [Pseudomonadota bacterium]